MQGLIRILKIVGIDDLIERLSSNNLSWSDFHTLLLHIVEKKIEGLSPADIMRSYNGNRFSAPGNINQKELHRIDEMLYSVLPKHFEAIELSPVNSIGASAVLTTLDPKVVLSTIRNMEVVGDSSMALAIDCAHRRKLIRTTNDTSQIHLATSHRVLRLQNFANDPGFSPHFRAFALASAARDTVGFNKFVLDSLADHIEVWLNFLERACGIGHKAENITVAISDTRITTRLISDGRISKEEVLRRGRDKTFNLLKACSVDLPDEVDNARNIPIHHPELETYIRELQFTEKRVIDPLRQRYPHVRFYFDLAQCTGAGYYSGHCYRVYGQNVDGNKYSLAGGGTCDWTRKLLNSKRERCKYPNKSIFRLSISRTKSNESFVPFFQENSLRVIYSFNLHIISFFK